MIYFLNSCGQRGENKASTLNNEGQPTASSGESNEKMNSKISDVVEVSAGHDFSMAVSEDGTLWAWGTDEHGLFGNGNKKNTFVRPQVIMDGVQKVSAGRYHSIVLKTDGTLWTAGKNEFGQLGDGTTSDSANFIKVLSDVIDVSAGETFSLALKKDSTLWVWGDNSAGQLGNGDISPSLVPIQVMQGVKKISAGESFTLAVTEDNTLWGWGINQSGQLQDHFSQKARVFYYGEVKIQAKPVKLMDNIVDAAAGGKHTMALGLDGSLWTWGNNKKGQLGDNWKGGKELYIAQEGSTKHTPTPRKVLSDVTYIEAGFNNSSAITKDGSLWVWGSNYNGEIGDGTTIDNGRSSKGLFW